MPNVAVARTYLELRAPDALRPWLSDDPDLRLVLERDDPVRVFRTLYRDIGGAYQWRDRNALSDDALRSRLTGDDVQLWVLYHQRSPAGFFELQRHADRSVEIVYFGLAAAFFGKGLGKHLLTVAAQAAWAFEADRVWLHTCTLDSPAALPNYLARGFEPFKVERYDAMIDHPAPA